MPASEAQIRANQQNAQLSTGPKTDEGKERSRQNSYKHGMTGAGTVLPEREAIEVGRRAEAFAAELQPSGEIAQALVRRAATLSVRMERCVEVENLKMTERVRQAVAEFIPPEGSDPETAAKLRVEAGTRAMFDPSREATQARQYEAAAERGFYRALKELRQMQREAKAAREAHLDEFSRDLLGSFSQMSKLDAEFDALYPEDLTPTPRTAPRTARPTPDGRVDVPITVGKSR